MNRILLSALIVFLAGCRYHVVSDEQQVTVGIPFIKGDVDGGLTRLLTEEMASSSFARFKSREARYDLHITLHQNSAERVGFRYDRHADGVLKKNIIGTETRKNIQATVEVFDNLYDRIVFGPKEFDAQADFDYVDSDNIADMSFVNEAGVRIKVFDYSLGQLNTIEGANDAAALMTYRRLSKKIADALALHFSNQENN